MIERSKILFEGVFMLTESKKVQNQYLSDHFKKVTESLIVKGNEIGVANHGTLKGSARELIISEFLSANLPRSHDFATGEIMTPGGERSGQLDIMLLPITAPKFSLGGDYALGLVHAVSAVIEVKSNLTTANIESKSELRNALNTTNLVKKLEIDPVLEPWPWQASSRTDTVRLENIPVSIVAFDGPTNPNILVKHLSDWKDQNNYLPNTITCLKHNYTLTLNDGWIYNKDRLPKTSKNALYLVSDSSLHELFDFLMKSLQAWSFAQPRTPLNAYR